VYGIVQAMAQTDIEIDIKMLDSAINLYKVKMDGWQTEFTAIKDQLQIELAKLEIYKQELEGKRLVAALNQQDIDYYKTRWDALAVQINLYKTRIDAANSLLQAELSKLEYSAKLVAIYAARISAYEAEWKAYSSAADAEKTKADIFESQTKAFASRVAAYASEVDAAKTIAELDVTTVKLLLESWQSKLEKYKSELQTELGRIDTLVKGSATESDVYKTKALVETAYTDFGMKKLEYGLSVDKLNADVELKEAELLQNRELSLTKIALDSLDGIARVGSQLTGSALSAMNVGASLSSGSTTSDQYTEYHYYEET
jgi:chromosome segregation ATPase